MRDWLTIIIVLLILGIVLDGVRRMRAYRKNALRISKNAADAGPETEVPSSEFPSGGARVVAYRDTKDIKDITRNARENYTASRKTKGSPSRPSEPSDLSTGSDIDRVDLNLDYEEETVAAEKPANLQSDSESDLNLDYGEPSLGSLDNLDDDQPNYAQVSELTSADEEMPPKPYVSPIATAPDWTVDSAKSEDSFDEFEYEEPEPLKDPDLVLVINVMARRGELFAGTDLLNALVDCGMRFGDMDIFHRHESEDGKGKVIFSLANIVMPGVFDISDMDQFETPGVSMFLSLPVSTESLTAYNLMANTALSLAEVLGGELKDEQRSVMTRQTIEHDRQRVIEYERKKRLERA